MLEEKRKQCSTYLNDQVKYMREAPNARLNAQLPAYLQLELIHHRVVIRRIVADDTENLRAHISTTRNKIRQ